jgi:hypothetical protein
MSRPTQECPRCGLTFRIKAKAKVKPANGNAVYLCGLNLNYVVCDYMWGKQCIYERVCAAKKVRKA